MIYKAINACDINLNEKEALRYSGIKSFPTDEEMKILKKCIGAVKAAAQPKAVYERIPLAVHDSGKIDFGSFTAVSKNLSKNMSGCSEAFMFAATLGYNVERLIIQNRLNAAEQLFISASASALIEDFCNTVFAQIKEALSSENKFLRPRFSPGYGDFDICHQRDIFSALELEKRLGITLTDGFFMVPSKSVTAVSAISTLDDKCIMDGCEICSKRDACQFSRTLTKDSQNRKR